MLKHFAILGCALAGFLALARGVAWYGPYIYDQADYMYALSLGLRANAFDTPSMPLGDFISLGMNQGRDSNNRAGLSALIRGGNDVLFYRHWHGPVYGYWLAFTDWFTRDARAKRKLNYLFAGAAALLLYFGALWILEGAAGQIAAILSLFLYLWSYAVVKTSELAPHQLFALLVVAALLLLSKVFIAPVSARRYWYGSIVVAAVAFCVLEVAFALVITVLLCGWIARASLKPDWRLAIRSLAVFLATVLVCWPAAILKLSPVKSYLFMAYLAVFRKAAWGAQITLADTWRLRFLDSPVLWLLLIASVALCFIKPRSPYIAVITPAAIFSALMFLATVRVNTDVPRYELPLLPGIVLLGSFSTALVMARWNPAIRNTAAAVLCAAIFASSWPAIRANLPNPVQSTDTMLALLRDYSTQAPAGAVLVPQEHLPMVHYYFPTVEFRAYYTDDDAREQLSRGGVAEVLTDTMPPRLIQIQPRAQ